MKRLFCLMTALMISLFVVPAASAQVSSVHEEKANWDLTYPVVTVSNNLTAQTKINNDIMTYIKDLKADFKQGRYYTCGGDYRVHYEDESILSISLSLYRYPYGAMGNHSSSWGIVYDKSTGKKIPLYNYVHVTPKDLNFYKYSHTYAETDVLLQDVWDTDITKIPTDYFLPGNGSICIIFPPYTLGPGVCGSTYIKLEPEYIEYLNRKNKK